MSSSEDEGIDVQRQKQYKPPVHRDDDFRIKEIVFDRSERLAVSSFQSLGVPLPTKLSSVAAEMFAIKEGILTATEEKRMKNLLAMEIPLSGDDVFRYSTEPRYNAHAYNENILRFNEAQLC